MFIHSFVNWLKPRSNFLFNAAVIIVSNYCGDCLLTPIYEKFFYKFALLFEFV